MQMEEVFIQYQQVDINELLISFIISHHEWTNDIYCTIVNLIRFIFNTCNDDFRILLS